MCKALVPTSQTKWTRDVGRISPNNHELVFTFCRPVKQQSESFRIFSVSDIFQRESCRLFRARHVSANKCLCLDDAASGISARLHISRLALPLVPGRQQKRKGKSEHGDRKKAGEQRPQDLRQRTMDTSRLR